MVTFLLVLLWFYFRNVLTPTISCNDINFKQGNKARVLKENFIVAFNEVFLPIYFL